MKAVWKYALNESHETYVNAPEGAQVLRLDNQHGVPTLWMLVDPDAPHEERKIRCVGTGFKADNLCTGKYIGTFIGETFVWHYFWE